MRVEMNLAWLVWALVLPAGMAFVVAWPLWRRHVGDEMGSIAGAGVVLAFAVLFVAREFGEVLSASSRCLAAGMSCRFVPQPFARYAIYAAIGMAQVFAVFAVGLAVQERRREPK